MLVLSRKPGEKLLIGDDVVITVVRIGPNQVRLGIDAPSHLNILREELESERKQVTNAVGPVVEEVR